MARDAAVQWLVEREVRYLIVDPFGSAYDGAENSNDEVRDWLANLDLIKREAGVPNLLLVTHTGRGEALEGSERARGATKLDDWADVRLVYTKAKEGSERYLRAHGRDVDVPECQIAYDRDTRSLMRTGEQNRDEVRRARGVDAVLAVLADAPEGLNTRELMDLIPGQKDKRPQAVAEAVQRGLVRVEQKGKAKIHFLAEREKVRVSDREKP